jgi:hypothetical protein
MSNNCCRMSGWRQPVAEACLPIDMPWGHRLMDRKLMGHETCLPTSDCYFRLTYLMRWQQPRPEGWLIHSMSLTSQRERFLASPQMNKRGAAWNCPSAWLRLILIGCQLAFCCFKKHLNNDWYISDIEECIWLAIYQNQLKLWVPDSMFPLIFLNGYIFPTWKRLINLATHSIPFK